MKKYYFDYNSTSPLAENVKSYLASGDFSFGNPSSLHLEGKKSKSKILETKEYLYKFFGLNENDYYLYFHSGATEAINNLVKGLSVYSINENKKLHFIASCADHSCVRAQKKYLDILKMPSTYLPVDENGQSDYKNLKIEQNDNTLLNMTLVNNELGTYIPLEKIVKIKKSTNALVHVDCAQFIGKISDDHTLSSEIDYYTFSGHKFGAMKGIGFSFIKIGSPFYSLIQGGGQQSDLRSGTENALGIYSLKLALSELEAKFNYKDQQTHFTKIYDHLKKLIGDKGQIFAEQAPYKNNNTVFFHINGVDAQTLLMAFDMSGVSVSTGSACSSGSVTPSKVLLAMGFSDQVAKSGIRLSFSPFLSIEDSKSVVNIITRVLSNYI